MTRIAVVRKDKCNHLSCGDLCVKLCPINRKGEDCVSLDDTQKAQIDEALCTGCGICSNRCPFEAISIINLPEELNQDPIHRYGQNGFALFNLPVPIFGKVVGILGKNGIGKSTAIKILAGIEKPNLGKDTEASYDKLIELFKGSEAHNFFEKVKEGKITISYKPQQVELIAKTQEGKVKDLLEKVDEKGKLDEISKILEINKILDNDIKNISGGELQRVAIAASVLKKADVYLFDEPTSYLDIKQRIKISKFIRDLADENTAVMVIEHDLIILDYITDLIHLMYGKSSCYGIVSQPKTSKAGINIYLEGFLKEENIRFRDKPISFDEKPPERAVEKELLTSWKNIKKQLGAFHLSSETGEINRKDVIGVLGENGIGKTSFVKILAKVIEPDEGELDENIVVSYKPQYLESDSEELVQVVLKNAIDKFDTLLIRPLQLKELFLKKLNELSGGELQRVSIALCLSKQANLYLMDEPSAYLDVEQRLIVSRVIKDFMEQKGKSALIVDHDLLFIDYISDNLMVFDGIPAEKGSAKGPFKMEDGMNRFLKDLIMTMRRDPESFRPRVNKLNSQMDQKQKNEGKLYYS